MLFVKLLMMRRTGEAFDEVDLRAEYVSRGSIVYGYLYCVVFMPVVLLQTELNCGLQGKFFICSAGYGNGQLAPSLPFALRIQQNGAVVTDFSDGVGIMLANGVAPVEQLIAAGGVFAQPQVGRVGFYGLRYCLQRCGGNAAERFRAYVIL